MIFKLRTNKTTYTFTEKFYSLNLTLILLVLLLGIISCFVMYSTDNGQFNYHTKSHIYRFVIFFILFILLSFLNINFWYKYAYIFYALFLILLVGVEFWGLTASGSKRWLDVFIFNLQPSELMKVGVVIFLAKYYHKISSDDVNNIKYFMKPLVALSIPIFLIIAQPDLGTAVLIAAAGLIMFWLAGVSVKYFFYSSIGIFTLLPIIIAFLKPYQKLRILTFLNPERDPLGAGYQIIQSKIAVGSGGLFGKGFLKGSQSYLDYLPEKHTDFIFTLFSEEFGFLGSGTLLLLYLSLIFVIINIGKRSRSYFARSFCYGFASVFFVCVVVNMSMVLGLLPIVGSPLPILSYGGSAMLTTMLGLAIVMSCHLHKDEYLT